MKSDQAPPSDAPFNASFNAPFNAPWEAQVFALVCALQDSGHLPPAEWSALLGEEIRLAAARGDPDLGGTYYLHCLAALEQWLLRANLAGAEEINERVARWRAAHLLTPHGEPVELR